MVLLIPWLYIIIDEHIFSTRNLWKVYNTYLNDLYHSSGFNERSELSQMDIVVKEAAYQALL